MKTQWISTVLVLCLLFSGCAQWSDGHYVSVKPHEGEAVQQNQGIASVKNYNQLYTEIQNTVERGQSSVTLAVEDYGTSALEEELQKAIYQLGLYNPIAAYAVENVSYEFGVTGGMAAVWVSISYNNNHGKIAKMKLARSADIAEGLIGNALKECSSEIVLRMVGYQELDVVQMIQTFAARNPDLIMEVPQVTVNVYPETGTNRVLEVLFTYQSSRDSLYSMQDYVQQIFASSQLYVAGEEDDANRYDMLCTFLMERNQYKLETSLTPAYSLLRHGVGDSRAFAITYAAMCRNADLECLVVAGTRAGEPWYWNVICENGVYYHLDLVRSHERGVYYRQTDEQMNGYVWDYSAYPPCGPQQEAEESEPQQNAEADQKDQSETIPSVSGDWVIEQDNR